MYSFARLGLGSFLVLAVFTTHTWADDSSTIPLGTDGVNINIVPNQYIIEFEGEPDTDAGEQATQDFFKSLSDGGISYTVYENYTSLFNGVFIGVDDKYFDAVYGITSAASVWATRLSNAGDQPPVPPNLPTSPPLPNLAHEYTGVNRVHNSTQWDGTGIKVGILDSGIDYNHPAFGSCYKTPGCRIQYGGNYVNDTDRADPLDTCNGHGTHVAGVLAGNHQEFRGVAPNATLGIYRIMDCKGVAPTNWVIKAAIQAHKDGMQVVNLSLGTPGGWRGWGESSIVNKLARRGIYVITAAGNNGMDGLWTVVSPAVATQGIAVGAMELPRYYALHLNVTVAGKTFPIQRTEQQTDFPPLNLRNVRLVRATGADGTDLACTPLAQEVKGALVLAQRGTCDYTTKAINVLNAGGVALAVYNNRTDDMGPISYSQAVTLPSFSLTIADGQALVKLLGGSGGSAATATVNHEVYAFDNVLAYTPASYSAWGPDPEGAIKPDLLAPGSNVYSTLPLNMGSYGSMSGTSMAAPYVTGLVALLVQSQRATTNLTLISNVVHTATPAKNAAGQYFSVAQQGTGLVNAWNALHADLAFTLRRSVPVYYDDRRYTKFPLKLWWENRVNAKVTYHFSSQPALSVSGVGTDSQSATPPRISTTAASVSFKQTSVSALAGNESFAEVTISSSKFDRRDFMVYSGYIQATPTVGTGGINYTLPYLGSAYATVNLPLLQSNYAGLPCLLRESGGGCLDAKSVHRFTLTGKDFPVVAYRLQAPARQLMIKIAYAATPNSVHASVESYLYGMQSRSMDTNGVPFYTFRWSGRGHYFGKPLDLFDLPNNKYVLRFTFLSVFMDTESQTYITPTIQLGGS
ncbi:hypothetical protein IWQ60_007905 [Tieghemiomyces parasiticus]|uniref:Uncharacterized protein n=1 Tax=Tieghemiomyces parasiticus TaxID=78921 RepID=A0A9W7ZYS6_9FUNG|nr:hypothetical protein IWQ60_007905 [Tieghemiomyces parasiticus]